MRIVWIAAALAAAFAAWAAWGPLRQRLFGADRSAATIVLSGNVEAHESVLSFSNVQGTLTQLSFDEGRRVAAGQVLARIDDRVYRRQLAIDRAAQAVALRQLQVARGNLAAQQATLLSDRADLAQKRIDLRIARGQLASGAASLQSTEQAATAAAQSAAGLRRDTALQRVAGGNVELAAASLEAARRKVALDRLVLGYTVLRAPMAGVLAVRQAELGELAGPGVAIYTLDDLDHVWVRCYLNELDLGHVRLGEAAQVRADGVPGHVWRARVSFVSPQAEFTPKTVETRAERVTLVYRLRVDVDNPRHDLLPGMPVEVTLARLPVR